MKKNCILYKTHLNHEWKIYETKAFSTANLRKYQIYDTVAQVDL